MFEKAFLEATSDIGRVSRDLLSLRFKLLMQSRSRFLSLAAKVCRRGADLRVHISMKPCGLCVQTCEEPLLGVLNGGIQLAPQFRVGEKSSNAFEPLIGA